MLAPPETPRTEGSASGLRSNAWNTVPATDPAGGIALNVIQTIPGAGWDAYQVLAEDDQGQLLSLVLVNN